VVELVEFRFFDPETPNFDADPIATPGILDPICYDVSVTAQ
jgi:hypothetical protein